MYVLPLQPQAFLYQEMYWQLDALRAQFRKETKDPQYADMKCLQHITKRFKDQSRILDGCRSFPGCLWEERKWDLTTLETANKERPLCSMDYNFKRIKSLIRSDLGDIDKAVTNGLEELVQDVFMMGDQCYPKADAINHVIKRLTQALDNDCLLNVMRQTLKKSLDRCLDYQATRDIVDRFVAKRGIPFNVYPSESDVESVDEPAKDVKFVKDVEPVDEPIEEAVVLPGTVVGVVKQGVVLSTFPPTMVEEEPVERPAKRSHSVMSG